MPLPCLVGSARFQVNIVETRRVGGKVRHEHIASLGSIETPLTVADPVAFWQGVHQCRAKLSNRIDPATQGKIRGDIHTQIPMVTPARRPAAICRRAARTCTGLMPWPCRGARCRPRAAPAVCCVRFTPDCRRDLCRIVANIEGQPS
jgi:hypothetical protein